MLTSAFVSFGEKASLPPTPTRMVCVGSEGEVLVVLDGVVELDELASAAPYAAKVKGSAPRRKVALLKYIMKYCKICEWKNVDYLLIESNGQNEKRRLCRTH